MKDFLLVLTTADPDIAKWRQHAANVTIIRD